MARNAMFTAARADHTWQTAFRRYLYVPSAKIIRAIRAFDKALLIAFLEWIMISDIEHLTCCVSSQQKESKKLSAI